MKHWKTDISSQMVVWEWEQSSFCWKAVSTCFDLFFCFGNWMRQGGGDVGIRRGMAVFAPPCFSPPPLETSPWEGFPAISNSKGREMWCKRGIFHFNCNTVLDKLGCRWLFCQGANRTCQCRGDVITYAILINWSWKNPLAIYVDWWIVDLRASNYNEVTGAMAGDRLKASGSTIQHGLLQCSWTSLLHWWSDLLLNCVSVQRIADQKTWRHKVLSLMHLHASLSFPNHMWSKD